MVAIILFRKILNFSNAQPPSATVSFQGLKGVGFNISVRIQQEIWTTLKPLLDATFRFLPYLQGLFPYLIYAYQFLNVFQAFINVRSSLRGNGVVALSYPEFEI